MPSPVVLMVGVGRVTKDVAVGEEEIVGGGVAGGEGHGVGFA
jgi:hypothetical protein